MATAPEQRKPPKRWRGYAIPPAIVLAVVLITFGCTSTILPPARVAAPTTVYLLLDDRHRGLILPDGEGRLIEYAYGEWGWYAMGHEGCSGGCRAMLWPTQGTLGRRATGAVDGESLARRFSWMTLHPVVVGQAEVAALRQRLEAEHASRRSEMVFSTRYGFEFVPHERAYWLLHNCNDQVAGWFQALGCTRSWVPVCLDLEVGSDPPEGTADDPAPAGRIPASRPGGRGGARAMAWPERACPTIPSGYHRGTESRPADGSLFPTPAPAIRASAVTAK